MKYPISTGQAAALLNVTEPQLAALVRAARIQPSPAVSAGRRQWLATHVFQAAKALGILTPELEELIADSWEGGAP